MTATWSVNRQLFKENAKNVKQDNQIMAVVKNKDSFNEEKAIRESCILSSC